MQRPVLGLLIGLVASFAAAGCGDEKVVAVGGEVDTTFVGQDGVDDTGVNPTPQGREIIVLHDASQPLQVRVANTQQLRLSNAPRDQSFPSNPVPELRFALDYQDAVPGLSYRLCQAGSC